MNEDFGTPDDDLLAAELAFGLLDDRERRAALTRVDADPAFARLHASWNAHAATLLDGSDEVPPAAVWQAIAAGLPANDRGPRLRRWQQVAASAAAALVVGFGLGVAVHRPSLPPAPVASPPTTTVVALLTGKDGGAVAIAYDRAAARLIVTPRDLPPKQGAAELWVIPADGKPISIGLLAAGSTYTTTPSARAAHAIVSGATLAVSLEPSGGSPTGQPTGPVILSGEILTS